MGWYLRKSVKLGPVRFNLSKSGIGTSVGVTGFRVGVRPNGKSYVHAGRNGVYFRQELSRNGGNSKLSSNIITEHTSPYNLVEFKTASSQKLIPESRKDFLLNLNKSYNTLRIDYLVGFAFLILAIFCFNQTTILGSIAFALGTISTIYIARWESKRRTITIFYDFKDSGELFQKIISVFNYLASNKSVWSMIDSRNIYGTHESKLNAGAGSLVNRHNSKIGEGNPPWVETNISVPIIKTNLQSLYFMPDGILVYDSRGVGFVEYQELIIIKGTTRFIEENPPKDATIVDKAWLHPNKDRGPDRRFNRNYQIPVCLYGTLKINTKSGMNLYLMTSKHDSPLIFKREFDQVF